jgi:hypothetical protein
MQDVFPLVNLTNRWHLRLSPRRIVTTASPPATSSQRTRLGGGRRLQHGDRCTLAVQLLDGGVSGNLRGRFLPANCPQFCPRKRVPLVGKHTAACQPPVAIDARWTSKQHSEEASPRHVQRTGSPSPSRCRSHQRKGGLNSVGAPCDLVHRLQAAF